MSTVTPLSTLHRMCTVTPVSTTLYTRSHTTLYTRNVSTGRVFVSDNVSRVSTCLECHTTRNVSRVSCDSHATHCNTRQHTGTHCSHTTLYTRSHTTLTGKVCTVSCDSHATPVCSHMALLDTLRDTLAHSHMCHDSFTYVP